MKRIGAIFLSLLFLTGCSRTPRELQQALDLRTELLSAEGCSFTADITADYGDSLQKFSLSCQGDAQGNVRFSVTEPEPIRGITGTLSAEGGKLTFDDHALAFSYLTDDQLSPVSGPWVFLRTLRGGYLEAAGKEGERIHVLAKDSYDDSALSVDLWLEAGNIPNRCEILYRGRRILTLEIRDFRLEKAYG